MIECEMVMGIRELRCHKAIMLILPSQDSITFPIVTLFLKGLLGVEEE